MSFERKYAADCRSVQHLAKVRFSDGGPGSRAAASPAVAAACTPAVTALAPLAPVAPLSATQRSPSRAAAPSWQLLLVAAARRSNNRVLRDLAGFAAHHTIELTFMVLVTLVGAAGFLVPGAVGPTAAARMLAPNGTVRWLAAILLGKLLIWDFPCAFFIKKVRSAVILGHHAGMAATCALALHVPFCTGLVYLESASSRRSRYRFGRV